MTSRLAPVLRHVRTVATDSGPTDRQLLDRFARHADGAAFAVLVRRHGPTVLGVCRRILRDWHDADDAFQATFLLLVRKAGRLRRPELLGNWLFGVARRVALKAKARAIRQRSRERPVEEGSAIAPSTSIDLRPLLDDAMARLPTRYRAPFVLCCVNGLTQAQTARQLGCPSGTVATRVARAKAQLRARLVRQGLAPAAAAIAVNLAPDALTAAVPGTLVRRTCAVAAGSAAGVVPMSILILTEGVGRTMLAHSWKLVFAAAAVLSAAGVGVGVWSERTSAGEPPAQAPPPIAVAEEPDGPGSHRSANFVVSAPSVRLARSIGEVAEEARKEIAIQWLGKEMPPWPRPCPVRARVTPGGTGGATTFNYDYHGGYDVMSMTVTGSVEQLRRNVIPHEVTHTVLAHHFRYPVPRWADEGAAMLAEDTVDQVKHEQAFRNIRDAGKTVPLRRFFQVKEYSDLDNVLVLHVQGASISRFLVERKDRPTFLKFVAIGMRGDWDAAARECYAFENVEQLEAAWLKDLRERKLPVLSEIPIIGRLFEIAAPPLPAVPPVRMAEIAIASVDDEGRLNVRHFTSATAFDVRRYSLLDIQGYRWGKTGLVDVGLRELGEWLRREQAVVIIPPDDKSPAIGQREIERAILSVIKEGTIVLFTRPKPPPVVPPVPGGVPGVVAPPAPAAPRAPVAVPALGPKPLALDFAFPGSETAGTGVRGFNFWLGFFN